MTPSSHSVSVVAGGAGFIGATLCGRLLDEGKVVVAVDNFSRGQRDYLSGVGADERFHLVQADLAVREQTVAAFSTAARFGQVIEVWHLAANSDIPAGVADADVDLKDTFLTTVEILRAMKAHAVGVIYFASSSAIYGDLGETELHESIGPLLPISNYGAMKLASEALISAAAESHLSKACLFRFPNVVGVPATHGVILDFVNKLIASPEVLHVLGDGTQQKAYLHVSDLVSAMLAIRARDLTTKVEVVNIGPLDQGVTVKWIAEQVVARVRPGAAIQFGSGNKGWVGDVPKFNYSTAKLQSYGWQPVLGSVQAIQRAVDEVALQRQQ
ncbi:SDR family NAD(P)-dependent oxidoreductase [Aquabacterium sp.]|uniref:SDR family NAD(P)-dependent oxidoreductase n=1 Tax=Aquabacterium sp. TaxID=1872578 RepID=UPI0019C7692D|nr:SDR family NAD(P)-dependent oxidoreductase [Aquabacterium sp.]MBC7700865.1 SDR family NAD(P)-dependent oxidoreductase [Aquabacterium sp.]